MLKHRNRIVVLLAETFWQLERHNNCGCARLVAGAASRFNISYKREVLFIAAAPTSWSAVQWKTKSINPFSLNHNLLDSLVFNLPSDGVERGEEVESLLGGEAEDGAALADDDEGLLVRVVRVDIADGSAGELQGELPVAPR